MDFVNHYLVTIVDKHLEDSEFPVDLAVGKLTHLCDKLHVLAGVSNQENSLGVENSLDDDDGDYFYCPHACSPSIEVGDIMYDSNGEEIVDEDEPGLSPQRSQCIVLSDSEEEVLDRKGKGKARSCIVLSESEEEVTGGKGKTEARVKGKMKEKEKQAAGKTTSYCSLKVCYQIILNAKFCTKPNIQGQASRDDMDISSEEESDRQSVLCQIQEVERAHCGPKSSTHDFWIEHLVTEKGKLKWEFKCKCCM